MDQSPCQSDSLSFTTGKLPGQVIGSPAKPNFFQQGHGSGMALPASHGSDHQGHGYIFPTTDMF